MKDNTYTPAQLQSSYRALNPFVGSMDKDSLDQDPTYNAFSSNMQSQGSRTISDADFPSMVQNADKFMQTKLQAYQAQGLSRGDAYSKALLDASQLAAPFSRKIKSKLLSQVHLDVLKNIQQQQ